jgi:hypothetical protein
MSIWRHNTGAGSAGLARWAMALRRRGGLALRIDRAEECRNPDRIARAQATIAAGLDALERVKFAKDPTIGEISVACAIGYIEFR